jgi:hypothetical protein
MVQRYKEVSEIQNKKTQTWENGHTVTAVTILPEGLEMRNFFYLRYSRSKKSNIICFFAYLFVSLLLKWETIPT